MKILFFSHIFPNTAQPIRGIFLKEMAIAMSKKAEVSVLAPLPVFPFMNFLPSFSGTKKIPLEEVFEEVRILRPRFLSFPKYIKWTESITLTRSIITHRTIIDSFARDCDIIFTHWVFPDTYVALKLARKFNKKTTLVVHGQKSVRHNEKSLERLFINYTLDHVDAILVLTKEMKKRLEKLYGVPKKKIEVIFNGVNTDKFKLLDPMAQRSRLNLPKKRKIIMGLGRLSSEKGFDILIDAFRQIYKEKNLFLLLVGDGPLKRRIEKKIKMHNLSGDIMLAGAKPYHELPHWYNACDLFCSPSYREEFPLNILEALCCGKPVIATEVGIAPEIIRKDLNGVLVPAGKQSDLAQAISWACHQRWSTEKIAAFGSNFSLDKSVNHTLKILGKMIES